MPFPGLRSYAP